MLAQLSIRNFALIESAEINFLSGYTAITGETGSGKSILLGALNLILGERADYSVIRDQEKKTVVEAVFRIREEFSSWFEAEDIDWSEETVIRREITSQGKSRAFINDTPVQLSQLKELTEQLVYIHSQHQTLELKNPAFQLTLIDTFAGLTSDVNSYASAYTSWKKHSDQLKSLKQQWAEQQQEAGFMQFQLDELSLLELPKNDYQAYTSELSRIDQMDELKSSYNAFSEGLISDNAAISQLRAIHSHTSKWKSLDPRLAEFVERIQSVIIELDDISSESAAQLELLEINPERQAFLLSAVDKFNNLLRKHNLSDQPGLMALQSSLEEKLLNTDSLSSEINVLEELTHKEYETVLAKAEKLHSDRMKATAGLKKHLTGLLSELKLPETQIGFVLEKLNHPDRSGISKVQLLFSANKGLEAKPIEKTASGGELSRLMLAVQYTLSSKKSLPTLILDEIDTGVSGEVALRIGNLLHTMGQNMQLLAITHLPQVAAKASHQFEVSKYSEGNSTNTSILPLTREGRKEAIAKLMSGDMLTDASLKNAGILMGEA